MSESNSMYAVKVNGEKIMAPSQEAAQAIAAALGGSVITLSRKEALASVREATKVPEYPPALADMLTSLKDTILIGTDEASLLEGSCWKVILQYDSKNAAWYSEVKNLANGPVVYNQTTGEKYPSAVQARWENGLSCAVKYLGKVGEDALGQKRPASAK